MNKKNIFKESLDLQIAAKNIGLDWLEIEGIIDKMKEETKEVDTDVIEEVLEKVEATSDQITNNNGESVQSETSLRDRFAKTFKDSVKFSF